MKYNLYQINPFNLDINLSRVCSILNRCHQIEISIQSPLQGTHEGTLDTEFFKECTHGRENEFCLFICSFPMEGNWFILRDNLDMNEVIHIQNNSRWIAATTDMLEELADQKDLDFDRMFAFNLYKAIRTSEWLDRGLAYNDEIYTFGLEDSSFIFCEDKMNFLSAFRSSKLGNRLKSNLAEHKFSNFEIETFENELRKIKGDRLTELFRVLKKKETLVNIFLSIIFGTAASIIANFIYDRIK